MITYKSLSVSPLLVKSYFLDQWFPVSYSSNFENGCPLSCIFCPINFSNKKIIVNKKNIFEELARECRNIPFESFIGIGGGHTETFHQEKNTGLENLIKLLLNHKHKLLFLTQTAYFKNYIHLFKKNKPIVVISLSSFDEKTNSILCPDSATIKEKIDLIRLCKKNNIPVGLLFAPIIFGVNDQLENLISILKIFQRENIDFFFFDFAKYETLSKIEKNIYKADKEKIIINNRFGSINQYFEDKNRYQYYIQQKTKEIIFEIRKLKLMPRIPLELLKERLSKKNLVIVLLIQIYFFLKYSGEIKKYLIYTANQLRKLTDEQFEEATLKKDFSQYFKIFHLAEKIMMEMIEDNFDYYHQSLEKFFMSDN